jgi:hypothetical protein
MYIHVNPDNTGANTSATKKLIMRLLSSQFNYGRITVKQEVAPKTGSFRIGDDSLGTRNAASTDTSRPKQAPCEREDN